MRNPHAPRYFAVLAIVAGLLVTTCSTKDSGPTEPEPNPNPAALTVVPAHGAPGTPLEITGYKVNPADTGLELKIGGELTVFQSDSSGLGSMIPLFLDSATHWPKPPTGALDVSLYKNGELVAQAKGALTVDSLPRADGATQTIQQDMQKLAASMKAIWAQLPDMPNADSTIPGYRFAVGEMMDSILAATDSSLNAVINGSSTWDGAQTPDLKLIDALMASSGALEYYNDAATSLARLSGAIEQARAQGILCRGGGEDMDLACQMQIYVLLDDYANYFVKPTSEAYANSVGLAAGIVAISGFQFPPEKIISGLMVVFDFVYGTLAPSLFPANITEFSLTVATDTIAVDEYTNTAVLVSASNNPATIRATDVLEQLLTALGLAKAPGGIAKNFREVLTNAMKWALGMYRKAVIAYNTQTNNSIFIDPEADLPPMSWGPVMVTHSDLVELYSFTEDIIVGDTAAFEWKGVSNGDGRIQARGRAAGERAKVLYDHALCLGCVYSGAAFGNNAPGTNTETVVVGKPAQLAVLITGLPDGTNASVIVTGPAGYNSGTLTATDTLRGLEPGDYHLTAIDVTDNTGEVYQPKPLDTVVTLAEGARSTLAVAYSKKYGELLLTVSGLPPGVEADIDVAGDGVLVHVLGDTLIDSLAAGSYSITAREIILPGTSDTLVPDPQSQNVQVNGGETATAAVGYGGSVTFKLHVGNPFPLIRPRTGLGVLQAQARVEYGSVDTHIVEYGQDPPLNDTIGPFPLMECDADGNLANSDNSGSTTVNAGAPGGSASASMSYTQLNDTTIEIKMRADAVSEATPTSGNGDATGAADASVRGLGWATLELNNPSGADAWLWFKYDLTATSASSDSWIPYPVVEFGSTPPIYSCSQLGRDLFNSVEQSFRIVLTSDATDSSAFRSIPPGKTYVMLHNFITAATNSFYKNGGTAIRTQNTSLDGTLTIYIKKQ